MAKGEIRYTLSADGTPMRQELSKAESDLKRWSGLVGKVSRDIEGSEKRVAREIAAVGAAVKKMGGDAQLTEPQLRRVADRLGDLEAKGGKIPPHLRAIADRFKDASSGASSLSKEIDAIKAEKLDEAAGKAGILGRVMSSLGPMGAAAAVAIGLTVGAATAVASTLAQSTAEVVAYSGRMTDMAAATGIGTESLQIFEHSAKLGGGSLEGLSTAAQKLKTNLANSPEKFDQLGLSVDRLLGMRPEDQLYAVAQALQGIENPTLRDAAAMDLLGKKSGEIFEILKASPSQVRAEMERLGLMLGKDTVAALDDLGDSAATLEATWTGLWRQIGAAIGTSPELKGLFDDLATLVGKAAVAVRDAGPEVRELASGAFSLLRDAITGVMAPLLLLLKALEKLNQVGPPGWLKDLSRAALVATVPGLGMAADAGALYNMFAGGQKKPASGPGFRMPGTLDSQDGLFDTATAGFSVYGPKSAQSHYQSPEQIAAAKAAAKAQVEEAERVRAAWQNAAEDARKAWDSFYGGLKAMKTADVAAMMDEFRKRNAVTIPSIERDALASIPDQMLVPRDPFNSSKPKNYNLSFNSGFDRANPASDSVVKSSYNVSQALQDLAHVASLSGSKLGKALSGIAGGGAGLAGGIGALFGKGATKMDFGTGIGSILGKAGMWGQVASSVLSIGSGIFSLFKKKPKPAPEPPPPPKERENVDAGGLASGLGGATKHITANTAEDIRAQSKILTLSFWQVFTEQGLVAAATSFKDVFDSIRNRLGELGGDAMAEAVLGPMATLMDKMDNEQFRNAAEGSQEYSNVLKELRTKEVPMTIDQFNAFQQQMAAAQQQAEAGGATTKESFAVIGPFLQEIISTAAQYGFAIDENTQKLIDQAKAAGVAFPTDPIDRLISKLDEFFNKLLGIDGKTVNVNVNARYTKSGDGVTDGTGTVDGMPGYARGTNGLVDFGSESIVALHNREAVLTEDQYNAAMDAIDAPSGGVDIGAMVGDVFREMSTQIQDLASAITSMAEMPGNIVLQPQVAVAVDAGSVRRNQEALIEQFQEEAAAAVRRGTSPILAALRDRGYRVSRRNG